MSRILSGYIDEIPLPKHKECRSESTSWMSKTFNQQKRLSAGSVRETSKENSEITMDVNTPCLSRIHSYESIDNENERNWNILQSIEYTRDNRLRSCELREIHDIPLKVIPTTIKPKTKLIYNNSLPAQEITIKSKSFKGKGKNNKKLELDRPSRIVFRIPKDFQVLGGGFAHHSMPQSPIMRTPTPIHKTSATNIKFDNIKLRRFINDGGKVRGGSPLKYMGKVSWGPGAKKGSTGSFSATGKLAINKHMTISNYGNKLFYIK